MWENAQLARMNVNEASRWVYKYEERGRRIGEETKSRISGTSQKEVKPARNENLLIRILEMRMKSIVVQERSGIKYRMNECREWISCMPSGRPSVTTSNHPWACVGRLRMWGRLRMCGMFRGGEVFRRSSGQCARAGWCVGWRDLEGRNLLLMPLALRAPRSHSSPASPHICQIQTYLYVYVRTHLFFFFLFLFLFLGTHTYIETKNLANRRKLNYSQGADVGTKNKAGNGKVRSPKLSGLLIRISKKFPKKNARKAQIWKTNLHGEFIRKTLNLN